MHPEDRNEVTSESDWYDSDTDVYIKVEITVTHTGHHVPDEHVLATAGERAIDLILDEGINENYG